MDSPKFSQPHFCEDLKSYQAYLFQSVKTLEIPEPSAESIEVSFELARLMVQEIQSKGALEFEQFMQMALYQSGLGYYAAGNQKFGSGGDFVTAPEISPLFAQSFAKQFVSVFKESEPAVLELGAGSGIFACDCLLELERLEQLPEQYFILEISPELAQRQKQTLTTKAPHLLDRVQWLAKLPDNFKGVVFANEVVDAIPVALYRTQKDNMEKAFVSYTDNGFEYQWNPADHSIKTKTQPFQAQWPEQYEFEYRTSARQWLKEIISNLESGCIFLVDYGYSQADLYNPNRTAGTLQQYYRHYKTPSPLELVGMQDITASVDFTELALAADEEGAQLMGYSSQAIFLMGAGIEHLARRSKSEQVDSGNTEEQKLEQTDASVTMRPLQIGQQLRQLLMPDEMGETCKVLAIAKNCSAEISGFSLENQLHKL